MRASAMYLSWADFPDRYIKEVKKATLIKEISPEQAIWSMYYEFSTLGVSSRVFTALQIAHLETEDGRRTGYDMHDHSFRARSCLSPTSTGTSYRFPST